MKFYKVDKAHLDNFLKVAKTENRAFWFLMNNTYIKVEDLKGNSKPYTYEGKEIRSYGGGCKEYFINWLPPIIHQFLTEVPDPGPRSVMDIEYNVGEVDYENFYHAESFDNVEDAVRCAHRLEAEEGGDYEVRISYNYDWKE